MRCFTKYDLIACLWGALFLTAPMSYAGTQRAEPGRRGKAHLRCDTPGVQLSGTLTTRTFFGPPGFGETPTKDARERVLILRLPVPITVDPADKLDPRKGSCWGAVPHLAAVQLFIFPEKKLASARKLIGKEVIASGTLREGDAPSEHTKIIMEVRTLRQR